MNNIYESETSLAENGTSAGLNAGESEARSGSEDAELVEGAVRWLEYFHQDKSAAVSFLRVPPDPQRDRRERLKAIVAVASVLAGDLQAGFRPVQPYLTKDAYFTVNGFYWGERGWQTDTGFHYVTKSKANLRTLNAAYCDLDCGRPDSLKPEQLISAQEALSEARQMVARGELPTFSAYAFSGQGLYLFWRLYDGSKPLSSWFKVPRYIAVNHAIYEKLRHLAADIVAKDASRILRLPNSIHAKTQNRVTYHAETDRVYTLEELEDKLNTGQSTVARVVCAAKPKPPVERMQGIFALNRYRAEEICLVEKHVGGWSKGARRKRLLIYAQILRCAGNRKSVVLPLVCAMAKRCQPPLDKATARSLVASAFSGKCYRRKVQTVCDAYGITPETVETLQLKSLAPPEIRANRKETRKAASLERRIVIDGIIRRGINKKSEISGRELSEECKRRGIQISPRQINRLIKQKGGSTDE